MVISVISGGASSRIGGPQVPAPRLTYSIRPPPLAEIDDWLGRYRALWDQRLDALHTEITRGKRERRSTR